MAKWARLAQDRDGGTGFHVWIHGEYSSLGDDGGPRLCGYADTRASAKSLLLEKGWASVGPWTKVDGGFTASLTPPAWHADVVEDWLAANTQEVFDPKAGWTRVVPPIPAGLRHPQGRPHPAWP